MHDGQPSVPRSITKQVVRSMGKPPIEAQLVTWLKARELTVTER